MTDVLSSNMNGMDCPNSTQANGAPNGVQNGTDASTTSSPVPDLPANDNDDEDWISLTSHTNQTSNPITIEWGAKDPSIRKPIIGTNRNNSARNAIGGHSGSYIVYRALAVASGALDTSYMPNYHNTTPIFDIGPYPSWYDEKKIATIDPFGHIITEVFDYYLKKGFDIRPTIAVTKAHVDLVEIKEAMRLGRLEADGKILTKDGQLNVSKAAVEPVWYLPEVARRFNCTEHHLRYCLFRETNGMYPELMTRPDLKVYLPPIGGLTVYIMGDPKAITDPNRKLAVRVHDECNGSDVFGSDICTCRPYLIHAMEVCVKTAQEGGAGVVVYFRKEGRALGEVTKYLVYNKRKRAEGGDRAEEYFNCTQNVAGVQDTRFQALMPDVLHWLGITKIDKFVSMSNMKYEAIVSTGIEIVERIAIPPDLVPADAQVEINAKVYAGYEGGDTYKVDEKKLKETKGREFF